MNSELHRVAKTEQDHARQVQEAARFLFGDASFVNEADALLAEASSEWDRICDGWEGLPTIALVGHFNSGKSWIAQRFLYDSVKAGKIFPDGGGSFQTDTLCWAGPERPGRLTAGDEQFCLLAREEMVDLGCKYQLLDTPGIGDGNQKLGKLAEAALSSAVVKILVVSERHTRKEDFQVFIGRADGAVILPVLNFCSAETIGEKREQLKAEFMEKLKNAAPHANLLDPILFPDLDKSKNPQLAIEAACAELFSVLRFLLNEKTADLTAGAFSQLTFSRRRFQQRRQRLFQEVLTPFASEFQALKESEQALPREALKLLFADSRSVMILLRGQFRAFLLEKIPAIAFPFRSMVGLLLLTSGAWDRLILATAGSLPSLLAVGYNTVRNIKEDATVKSRLCDQLKLKLSGIIRETVSKPLLTLQKLLQEHGSSAAQADQNEIDFAISGAEELSETWNAEVRRVGAKFCTGRWLILDATLLATLAFWFLLGGPLVHVYGQYVPSALASWGGAWSSEALDTYPALTSGFWLTSLLVSILPAFLLALALVGWTLRNSVGRNAKNEIQAKMKQVFEAEEVRFAITIKDERLGALEVLLKAMPASQSANMSAKPGCGGAANKGG